MEQQEMKPEEGQQPMGRHMMRGKWEEGYCPECGWMGPGPYHHHYCPMCGCETGPYHRYGYGRMMPWGAPFMGGAFLMLAFVAGLLVGKARCM